MLKRFDHVIVFGDSYSTPDFCVSWQQSFWAMAADQLGCTRITNYSVPGIGLDLMTHLLITNQDAVPWGPRTLVLFCAAHLERVAVHDMDHDRDLEMWALDQGQVNTGSIPHTHGLVPRSIWQVVPEWARIYERSWTDHHGLMQLHLIHNWIEQKHTPFVIMNMCVEYARSPGWPTDKICDWWAQQPNAIIFDGTYRDINIGVNLPVDHEEFGVGGHHGAAGNLRFLEGSLWPVIERCYLQ